LANYRNSWNSWINISIEKPTAARAAPAVAGVPGVPVAPTSAYPVVTGCEGEMIAMALGIVVVAAFLPVKKVP